MTSLTVIIIVLCMLVVVNFTAENATTINPMILSSDNPGSCVTAEATQDAIASLQTVIRSSIECGGGLWYPVASLDMTNPQQQCPIGWREYNENSVRACGRPVTDSSSYASVSYTTWGQYSKVCGRVIGYQVTTPDGFLGNDRAIDNNYVDGVSITYGKNPRQHIWTYAAGATENSLLHSPNNCPCSDLFSTPPQKFVGNRFYCESGNPTSDIIYFNSSDKLWDGEQCSREGICCTNMSPPWFSVELTNATTDDIEVRICGDESTSNEDTPIELLNIYIQ